MAIDYDKLSHQELEAELMRRQLKDQDNEDSPVTFKSTFGILWNAAKFIFYGYLILMVFIFVMVLIGWTGIALFNPVGGILMQ